MWQNILIASNVFFWHYVLSRAFIRNHPLLCLLGQTKFWRAALKCFLSLFFFFFFVLFRRNVKIPLSPNWLNKKLPKAKVCLHCITKSSWMWKGWIQFSLWLMCRKANNRADWKRFSQTKSHSLFSPFFFCRQSLAFSSHMLLSGLFYSVTPAYFYCLLYNNLHPLYHTCIDQEYYVWLLIIIRHLFKLHVLGLREKSIL